MTEQFFELPDGRAIFFNPDSHLHGWLFYRHANGSLVPFQKLQLAPLPYMSDWQPMETAPKGHVTESVGCRSTSDWFEGRVSAPYYGDHNPGTFTIRRRAWPQDDGWQDQDETTFAPDFFDGWRPLPQIQGNQPAEPEDCLKFEVTDELIAAAAYAMVLLGQKHRAEGRDGPSRREDAKAALQAVAAIVEARREQAATIPPRLCYWDKATSCDCITMCDCPHLRLFRLRGQLTESPQQ